MSAEIFAFKVMWTGWHFCSSFDRRQKILMTTNKPGTYLKKMRCSENNLATNSKEAENN